MSVLDFEWTQSVRGNHRAKFQRHHLTISQAGEVTGLSAYTLRYYERIGLIDRVGRDNRGHRRYSEGDLRTLKFLMYLRDAGMSIEEMLRFMNLYRLADDARIPQQHEILAAHRERVQAQIDTLCATRLRW